MIQPDFIQIPTQLLTDESLQPSDRILFGYIYWMTKLALMKCVASNDTLGTLTGLSTRAVQLSLLRLEKQGYVRRIFVGEGDRNRESIECLIAYSALKPKNERTGVRTRANKNSYDERTGVRHNKKREEEDKIIKSSDVLKEAKIPVSDPLYVELAEFVKMRKTIRKPVTEYGLRMLREKLVKIYPNDADMQRQCLNQSIENSWQGVFAVKNPEKTKDPKRIVW